MEKLKISAVDLFCGIGGLSFGLKQSGIKVKAGIDFDNSCKYAYEKNCNSKFIYADVSNLKKEDISQYFEDDEVKVLVGCAPCQPFSTYTMNGNKQKDQKWQLLYQFARLIKETEPDIVSMENVPNLINFKKEPVLDNFIQELKKCGYWVWHDIVYSPNYGIPQKRKRLVLLASKKGDIKLIDSTHKPNEYVTVKDVIGDLVPIKAGEIATDDFMHRSAKISEKNLKRIQQSKPGGTWKTDWDEDLKLQCHKKQSGKTYGSIYGRMRWDEPSPTMTTFCTGIGNGRFGHPEQDRAISLREAAILQTFPKNYSFTQKKETLKFGQISRQIGNAVPPKLGEVIGISIIKHLKEYANGKN